MHIFDNAFHELVQNLKFQVDDISQDINTVSEMLNTLKVKQGILYSGLEGMMALSEVLNSPPTPEEIPTEETVLKTEPKSPSPSENQPTDFTAIKLSSIIFPDDFSSLQRFLINYFGNNFRCSEFLNKSDNDFLSIEYFGLSKLDTAKRMQSYLLTRPLQQQALDLLFPDKETLSEYQLNYALLDESQRKLVEKMARVLKIPANQVTVSHIVYDTDKEIMKSIVAGQRFEDVYAPMIKRIHEALSEFHYENHEELKEKITGGKFLNYIGTLEFTPHELSTIISNDLTTYLVNTDERSAYIIRSRFGLDGYQKATLQSIADSLEEKLTRERVRQLENDVCAELLGCLSIHPANIWSNVRNNAGPDINQLYPDLSRRFTRRQGFIAFLEMISNTHKGELDKLLHPECNVQYINELAAYTKAPIDTSDVLSEISERYGYTEQQAHNALQHLIESKKLALKNQQVYLISLSKAEAFAQAAIYFPNGAAFRDIHQFANNQGFCKSLFPLDRQDHGVTQAVDEGLVYLSAHGMYRHVCYLELSEEEISSILESVYQTLVSSISGGVDTLNLRVDVYEKKSFSVDYYVVRHVVREYGLQREIFFAGKSGADTVSLEENFILKGQKEAIVQMFEKSPSPRTRDDIVAVIKSGSRGHAAFYINQLMLENRLVRIDASHYDVPSVAFADQPVSLIMERATIVLHRAKRPVEIGIIAEECNTRLHLEFPKAWYLSLLRYFCKKYGKTWYYFHNLVSETPLNGLSLSSLTKNVLEKYSDENAVFSSLNEQILADETLIKQAIKNVKNQRSANILQTTIYS
ncbi:hypothetical protein [Pectobacterium versatile]|uniref:hypothetical protein n=1 Tax=Pectobacterium versatile TaxID=2488639 RepID=UPI00102F0636|nr:hypothetical protein [Pectobacterium versatile]TAI88695.1 hypothetical protein EG333_05860 [Pectobacterium versatile]TAJ01481.1 hypothetical protein EG334_22925 [Pectobacterium versatile]